MINLKNENNVNSYNQLCSSQATTQDHVLDVNETVAGFLKMRECDEALYLEAIWQYKNMSLGGNGGPVRPRARKSFRAMYYPRVDNMFFSRVLFVLDEVHMQGSTPVPIDPLTIALAHRGEY